MQKVEGSSPFIRFANALLSGAFVVKRERGDAATATETATESASVRRRGATLGALGVGKSAANPADTELPNSRCQHSGQKHEQLASPVSG
jgi:hypothetical protein